MIKQDKIDLGSVDEGLQTFTYNNKTITLDILDVAHKLEEIRKQRLTDGELFSWELDEVRKLLEAEGLEQVTKVAATKFIKYIKALCEELKKNIEQTALLPTPTA